MAKKKMQFYEEMEFDDVRYAVDIVNEHGAKLKRVKKGLIISVCAIACTLSSFVIGLENPLSSFLIIAGLIGSIAAYIVGGGFSTAIRWAWKIAVFGWIIIPFPFDLLTGFACLYFAFFFFLFVPTIFVYMNYRQINMDYMAAKKYVSYFKAKNPQKPQSNARITTSSSARTGTSTGVRTYSQATTRTSTQTGTRTYSQTATRTGTQAGTRTYTQSGSRTGTRGSTIR